MKKLILIAVSMLMLGGAPTKGAEVLVTYPPQPTCKYADEVLARADGEIGELLARFERTKAYTPEREVLGAQINGVVALIEAADAWKNKNCKES